MPTLKPSDYVIAAVILLVGCYPLVMSGFWKLLAAVPSLKVPRWTDRSVEVTGWREQWVQTLMKLQSDLESKPEQATALKLCRGLIWELLGGGPTP